MAPGNFSKGNVACPACGRALAPRSIHDHTGVWGAAHGAPWPKFKYDAWAPDKRPLFAEGAVEGRDYVSCRLCAEKGWDFRFSRLVDHLKAHQLPEAAYLARFPGAQVRLSKTTERRQETTLAVYGVDNISRSEVARESTRRTSQARYGVDHASQAPEVQQRRRRTNLEIFGVENPFAAREVKEKIRRTHMQRRGVENPSQDPAVITKRMETNQERYGADHYVETSAFQEKYKVTANERHGADHHMQTEQGQMGWQQRFEDLYGAPNPFSVPEIAQRAYANNLANHGGKHSQQCEDVLAKARATWLEKYGVDNPRKAEEVKARIKAVWEGKYGVPFPPQSLRINRDIQLPTRPERAVIGMAPECVVYAGDRSYWVRHAGSSKVRNPDFVVLSAEQCEQYRAGAKLNDLRTHSVIEVFGDYWHGPEKTGKAREAHKQEVVDFYDRAGLRCLVLWESEIKQHPQRVGKRIQRFLAA